jgi:hypothetical protein
MTATILPRNAPSAAGILITGNVFITARVLKCCGSGIFRIYCGFTAVILGEDFMKRILRAAPGVLLAEGAGFWF